MKRYEYETELKHLYGKAVQGVDFRLAFDILEVGRMLGLEGMSLSRKEAEEDNNDN